jgi:hypothetical protein
MRALCLSAVITLSFVPQLALAGDIEWRRYTIASTGASVDMPVSIFTSDAGAPEGGTGRKFFTEDRRADFTVQSVANPSNDSPATFLARMQPPAGIKTDEHARALDADGQPIPGLYAAGNDMASIMGGNYPGAGITLGPALTFGYIAGKHLAGENSP